jgi:hypothetical protein
MLRLQDLLNPAVATFDHAVALRARRRSQAVFDSE